MKKIYAILVTYNPELANLNQSLKRIIKEVNGILICNNSNQNVEINIKNVECINFGENLGIAKAQSVGMDIAFKKYNADFIIQFDQDSLMDTGMIQKLLSIYEKKYKQNIISIVGPQDYDRDTLEESKMWFFNKNKQDENLLEVETLISSGCLISKNVYEKVGSMKNEWFIDIVDFEYCWRAKKNGIKIYKVINAKLSHKLGDGKIKTRLGFKINIGSPIRHYYQFRNILYSFSLSYVPLKWKLISLVKLIFKFTFYRFLLKDGLVRYNYMVKGIEDFTKKKVGKINIE